jgi:hypothetical protein
VTEEDSGQPGGAAPKLTIGQRILTALPSLQRDTAPAAPPRPPASPRRPARTAPDDAPSDTAASDTAPSDTAASDTAASDDIDDDDTAHAPRDHASGGPGKTSRTSVRAAGAGRGQRRQVEELESMSREEIAHRIKRLDDRERLLALTSAPLGAVVGILLTAVTIHLNPPVGHAKHVADSTIYFEGAARIVLSGVVALAALTRRRSFVGFALLFLGTSMGAPLFALPFWALGGYLIWRVFKYQKALNARGGAPGRAGARGRAGAAGRDAGGGRVPASPRPAGRAGAAAARQRAKSPSRRGRKEPAPSGPTPSKRYTPPRPTRPRPPASPS